MVFLDRATLERYIEDRYGARAEHLWDSHPGYMVFRHGGNRKWFAVVMDLPGYKLGLDTGTKQDVLNVKCDPLLIGSLLMEPGIYPAYHMNKAHWVTVPLEGGAEDGEILDLLHGSFLLTAPKLPAGGTKCVDRKQKRKGTG